MLSAGQSPRFYIHSKVTLRWTLSRTRGNIRTSILGLSTPDEIKNINGVNTRFEGSAKFRFSLKEPIKFMNIEIVRGSIDYTMQRETSMPTMERIPSGLDNQTNSKINLPEIKKH